MSQRISEQRARMDGKSLQLIVSLGQALREARQNRGEDLYDVANYLRIKPSYLFALEEGDVSLTPGRAYALGFIRSYAEYLGFDGNDVVRQVKQALDRDEVTQPLRYRTPINAEKTRPSGFLLGLSIVLIGLIYGTWHIYFRGEPMLDRVTAVPGDLGRMTAELLNVSPSAEPESDDTGRSEGGETSRPTVTASASQTPQAETDKTPAPAPTSTVTASATAPAASGAAAPQVTPAPTGATTADLMAALRAPATTTPPAAPVPPTDTQALPDRSPAVDPMAAAAADAPRVVLVARENSWVQVRSANRDFVRTMTLAAGQTMELPNRPDLNLWTGNAGGLDVVVDGQNLGTFGQVGRVVRDVSLSPTELKARQGAVVR